MTDALERLEAMKGTALYFANCKDDVEAVCRELKAAREAVTILGEEYDPEIKAWNDALRMVNEKMESARTNPVSPPSE